MHAPATWLGGRLAVVKRLGVPRKLSPKRVDGGTLNFLETIVCYRSAGLDVEVFTSGDDGPDEEQLDGVTVHRLRASPGHGDGVLARDLDECLEFSSHLAAHPAFDPLRFQWIHTHHWSSMSAELAGKVCATARLLHTPHLLAVEKARLLGGLPPPAVVEQEHRLLHLADRIIAVSQQEKASIVTFHGVMPSRVRVVRNGVSHLFLDGPQPVPPASAVDHSVRVVTVGRIARQKGIDVLLAALRDATDSGLSLECTVVGGSYREWDHEREIEELVSGLRLGSIVRFAGALDRQQVRETLALSTVYLQLSRYESQGVALLEAMAAGLPIVASRLPAIEEMARDGVNGYLVPVGDHRAAAAALAAILRHPETWRRMSLENRAAARRSTWDRFHGATLRVLQEAAR